MALLHTLQENGRGYECFSSCGHFFFSVDLLFHALQESSCDHLFVSNVLHTLQGTSRDHLYVNHLLHTLHENGRGYECFFSCGQLFFP